jgi:hypothetical protein
MGQAEKSKLEPTRLLHPSELDSKKEKKGKKLLINVFASREEQLWSYA